MGRPEDGFCLGTGLGSSHRHYQKPLLGKRCAPSGAVAGLAVLFRSMASRIMGCPPPGGNRKTENPFREGRGLCGVVAAKQGLENLVRRERGVPCTYPARASLQLCSLEAGTG